MTNTIVSSHALEIRFSAKKSTKKPSLSKRKVNPNKMTPAQLRQIRLFSLNLSVHPKNYDWTDLPRAYGRVVAADLDKLVCRYVISSKGAPSDQNEKVVVETCKQKLQTAEALLGKRFSIRNFREALQQGQSNLFEFANDFYQTLQILNQGFLYQHCLSQPLLERLNMMETVLTRQTYDAPLADVMKKEIALLNEARAITPDEKRAKADALRWEVGGVPEVATVAGDDSDDEPEAP